MNAWGEGPFGTLVDWFVALHPAWQALMAGTLTWLVTAAGAAVVFLRRSLSPALLDSMLGFAAGVMIAASIWSLLIPAMELAARNDRPGWVPAAVGFLTGGIFLRVADQLLPHLHPRLAPIAAEGVQTNWRRATLLVMAITLHNIPEGIAIGVAFAAAATGDPSAATFGAAVALTIGIALQNFPEGLAVSMPLRHEGISRARCFNYGQLSAIVEPFGAVLGALAVVWIEALLPYALAFAAGAMIYVVVEELIPESQQGGHGDLATTGTMVGFVIMMMLDVALG